MANVQHFASRAHNQRENNKKVTAVMHDCYDNRTAEKNHLLSSKISRHRFSLMIKYFYFYRFPMLGKTKLITYLVKSILLIKFKHYCRFSHPMLVVVFACDWKNMKLGSADQLRTI
jgi:hypothetical protein